MGTYKVQLEDGSWVPMSVLGLPSLEYAPIVVSKPSSTTMVTSAQEPDPHLFYTLTPGTWRIQAVIRAAGDAAADFKMGWAFTGVTSFISRACFGPPVGTTDVSNTVVLMRTAGYGTQIGYGVQNTGTGSLILEDILAVVTGSGVFQLVWGQVTTNAIATTLSNECRVYFQKCIGP